MFYGAIIRNSKGNPEWHGEGLLPGYRVLGLLLLKL